MTDGRCARLSWFEPQLDETTDQHPARARCGRSLRRPGRRCDGNRTLTTGIPGEDPKRTGRFGGRGTTSPPAATTCPPADLRIRRGVSFWGSYKGDSAAVKRPWLPVPSLRSPVLRWFEKTRPGGVRPAPLVRNQDAVSVETGNPRPNNATAFPGEDRSRRDAPTSAG